MSVRSEYIKNLIADKENLSKSLTETTHQALQEMVDESIVRSMKKAINEANDDYEEEEVDSDNEDLVTDIEEPKTDAEDDVIGDDDDVIGDTDSENLESGDEDKEEDVADGDEEEDMWASLEQYKDENGEYDLTGMDKDSAIKVLKVMKPENGDSVRVVKTDDGKIEVTDDETGAEYVIELGEEDADEPVYELDIEEGKNCHGKSCDLNEDEIDLGYTTKYPGRTPLGKINNKETADKSNTYSMDAGAPEGNPPYGEKVGDGKPYEKIYEVEIENNEEQVEDPVEESTTVADKNAQAQGTTKTHGPNTSRKAARNGSVAGVKVKSTSVPRYDESIMRTAKRIFNENKQLKAIAEQIKERLNEACVVNSSLAKIIKLVTENTTTRQEKVDIVNRFNNVKTINEGKNLYNVISEELKKSHPINDVTKMVDGQLSEAKKSNIVETSMYQSNDLLATLDLMKRMENL